MKSALLLGLLSSALLWGVIACSDDDDPVGGAGSAGTGGNGATGGAGGSGGGTSPVDGGLDATAGTGGLPGDSGGEAGTATFVAVVQGARMVVTTEDDVWTDGCSLDLEVLRWSGDGWVPLRDERPEGTNLHKAAHYVDGSYRSDCGQSLGCDYYFCSRFDRRAEFTPLSAVEYVEVGQRAATLCSAEDAGVDSDAGSDTDGDAGVRIVPVVEQITPTSPLAVRIRYFASEQACSDEQPAFVQLVEVQ